MSVDQKIVSDAFAQLLLMEKLEAGDAEYFAFAEGLLEKLKALPVSRLTNAEKEANEMYRSVVGVDI